MTCGKWTRAKAKATQSPAAALRSGWENAQSLLLPVAVSMAAGDSSSEGVERPDVLAPEIAQCFSLHQEVQQPLDLHT